MRRIEVFRKTILIFVSICLFSPAFMAQQVNIGENLTAQLEAYPQEKIHVHTDRDFYVPGEKIWFKAYVTDAATHLYPTNSRYVFVELISPEDTLVGRVMIRPIDGMFHGNLPLTDFIPEGNYTLRAYTKYMENLGDDYFFKKNIRIGNLSMAKKQQSTTDSSTSLTKQIEDDFDVSFYPEGGNLLEGVFCKVAFKAINKNGYPEIVSGEITDENGTEITSIKTFHAGMGAFSFIPHPGKQYFLKCRNGDGIEKQFELPQPEPRAYALTASKRNNRLSVGVQKSASSPDISCYLLAHCRGMVLYFAAWNKENENVTFSEKNLPSGVIQFILFDEQMNPLSERLIFNINDDASAKVDFQTDKETYQIRDKIVTTLSFPDSLFDFHSGHFSIAVTDDKDIEVDESTTIFSSLLLSSELKGYIENPAYYLQDVPESVVALDYLMLTHGWRRYNVPEVVVGNYESPQLPFQTSQTISGKLIRGNQSRPVPDSEVLITADGDFGLKTTDKNGTFVFDNFEYPDSTSYFLQALDNKGFTIVELVLDGESFPKPVYAPQSPFVEIPVIKKETEDDPEPNAFMVKAEQRAQFEDDIWTLQIEEVAISAPRIERKDEPRLQYWANGSSSETIRREDFVKKNPTLVSQILLGIPGVKVSSNGSVGISQMRGKPLVLIDGLPFDWPDPEDMKTPYNSPLEKVTVYDVESIDVFKGVSAATFGVRGDGGVISITTRRGIDVIREVEKIRENKAHNNAYYTPLGYQKPIAFYSPKYETLEAKQSRIPDYRTTIFWKPDVVISEDGEASFQFYTSDFRTTYSVVIEGITADGKMVRQVEKIQVE